jgi:uncharacterized membrane protein YccC
VRRRVRARRLTRRTPTFGLDALRVAVQIALVSLLAYVGGFRFTSLFHDASADIGALWSVISGILVLQATRRSTWSSACFRLLGTLVGSIISALYLSFLSFSPIGLAACTLATVLLCHAARIPEHARLAAFTVAVMMVLSNLHSTLTPILSGVLRLGESGIGAAMAVLVAFLWPEPAGPPGAAPR